MQAATEDYATAEQREWLAAQFDGLTTSLHVVKPSEWAEQNRYLPPSVTPLPGYYSFDVAPYIREPLDCLSVDSPVREMTFMKGVQICATVGVLENAIGYYIAHVSTAPMMLITADSELAKLRMESYITPMLQASGLEHLIKSADENNSRKKGKTDRKIEWIGGGFLVPLGAQNANKLRSASFEIILRDEIDGWPAVVGKDGDPIKLSADRAAAFEGSRKIANVSTPLIEGQSKIKERFLRGDQRYYLVRCLKCNAPQRLRWRREDSQTGEVTGITWEMQNGVLAPDSVRYLCKECSHPHTDADKARLLSPDHGAAWKPTAEAAEPYHRSYHLSALYSPPGMQSWGACVLKYLDAWDVERNRMREPGKLQVFYNNVLGETFEMRGERVRLEAVSPHKRSEYHFGQIPNKYAERHCGGPVLLLTCTVDVHADNLAVAVFGWCRDRRAFLINYWRFEGNTEQLDDKTTWKRLDELITEKVYVADDGKQYRIGAKSLTLIDSGYRTDQVYQYCDSFHTGVFPVKGREKPPIAMTRDFSEFKTPTGMPGYLLTVDNYKDRWSAALRREWDGQGMQPVGHFNAPHDTTEAQLKELTVETKVPRAAKGNGQDPGFEWRRRAGAPNELWDCLVYGNAALELVCWDYCRNALRLDYMNWTVFYDHCLEKKLYFT